MNANDLIVVIILNYNKNVDLQECLQSLSNVEYSPLEIIVVDNGSTDSSVSLIKRSYKQVHLVESKLNLGVAGGRNLGIRYANEKFDYRFLLFLDNDVIIEKNILLEMVKSFRSVENVGIVTPKCYMYNSPKIIDNAGGLNVNLYSGKIKDRGGGEEDNGQYDKPILMSSSGGIFLISKTALTEAGFFDEKFNPYGWEDVDYSLRVRKMDYIIIYSPKAIIYHKGGKLWRKDHVSEYERFKIRNYFYLLRKHASLLQLFTIILCLPFITLGALWGDVSKGKSMLALYKLRGLVKYRNK